MIHTVPPDPRSEQPIKVFKHLLIYAVRRLAELGDEEGVSRIMECLPEREKKG